jgi:putative transposase
MARRPDPKLHTLWRDRVRRQQASGLTIAQFCAQERIARSKFHAWKRRFRLMSSPAQCPALPAPSVFLPVTVRLDDRTTDELLPIEADLPNGIRLRIPTGNARLACRLVRSIARARTDSGGSR